MFDLFYIPEIILSIGILLVIIIDLYIEKQKYFSYLLIQSLILLATFFALTEVPIMFMAPMSLVSLLA